MVNSSASYVGWVVDEEHQEGKKAIISSTGTHSWYHSYVFKLMVTVLLESQNIYSFQSL